MMNRINSYPGDHHKEPFLNSKKTLTSASEIAKFPDYMWVAVAMRVDVNWKAQRAAMSRTVLHQLPLMCWWSERDG